MLNKKNKTILSIVGTILIIAMIALIYVNIHNKKVRNHVEISKEKFQSSEKVESIPKAQTIYNTSTMEITNYEYEEGSSEKNQNMTHSTSSYTPENIDISDNKINKDKDSSFDFADLENRNLENVKVEVLEETITANGLTVIITDNNDISYTWHRDFYKVEQKINGTWQEVLPEKPLDGELIGYTRDENNQFKFEINWTKYYGTLENGIYRIVEIPINYPGEKTYNCAYSNEFEINE